MKTTNPNEPFDPSTWEAAGNIVAVAGFAGVGKDTLIRSLGYPRAAFADALKADLHAVILHCFGIDIYNCTREQKELVRPLLVEHGRTGRAFDSRYWIKRLQVPSQSRYQKWMGISDLRYANEAEAVYAAGGVVIYLYDRSISAANQEEADSFREMFERYPDIPQVMAPRGDLTRTLLSAHRVIFEHFSKQGVSW